MTIDLRTRSGVTKSNIQYSQDWKEGRCNVESGIVEDKKKK